MNPKVDVYLADGCGRCSLYRTSACKVHKWAKELMLLRQIVLECGLQEELKWSQPCYTYQSKNILIVTAFKDYAAIAFFKGTLLQDSNGILIAPSENSQAIRQIRFTNIKDIIAKEPILKTYIFEAIEVEKAGLKVHFTKKQTPFPDELQNKMNEIPALKYAFEALTPGRQRGYLHYFSQAKQSQTRLSRIEKYLPKILNGKGLNDR